MIGYAFACLPPLLCFGLPLRYLLRNEWPRLRQMLFFPLAGQMRPGQNIQRARLLRRLQRWAAGCVGVQVGVARLVIPAEQIGQDGGRKDKHPSGQRVQVHRTDPSKAQESDSRGTGSEECDLRGLRVEEGIDRLRTALDRCMADGCSVLRVIHGHGSGALRRAVREHLIDSPWATEIRAGDREEGGEGVTWVRLA